MNICRWDEPLVFMEHHFRVQHDITRIKEPRLHLFDNRTVQIERKTRKTAKRVTVLLGGVNKDVCLLLDSVKMHVTAFAAQFIDETHQFRACFGKEQCSTWACRAATAAADRTGVNAVDHLVSGHQIPLLHIDKLLKLDDLRAGVVFRVNPCVGSQKRRTRGDRVAFIVECRAERLFARLQSASERQNLFCFGIGIVHLFPAAPFGADAL